MIRIKLKSSIKLLCNKPVFNAFIILHLVSTVFLVNSLVMFYLGINQQLSIVNTSKPENSIYHCNSSIQDMSYLEDLENVKSVDKIYEINATLDNKYALTTALSPDLYNLFEFPLSKGRWYSNESTEYLEIVISSKFNIPLNTILPIVLSGESTDITMQAKVVGILPRDYMKLSLKRAGKYMSLDNILIWNDEGADEIINLLDIFCNLSVLEENLLYVNHYGRIITFDDDISVDDYNHNLTILDNHGISDSLQTLIDNSKITLVNQMKIGLPYVILALIITIASFFLMVLIIVKHMSKYLSIIYLLGASWKDLRIIIILYSVMISIMVFMLNILISGFIPNPFSHKNIGVNNYYNVITLCMINSLFIFASLLISKVSIKKRNTITNLGDNL